MDWKVMCKDKAFWRKVLLWSVLLAIAPLAMEVLILADVVGIEIAMAFFAYYIKDVGVIWRMRAQSFAAAVSSGVSCIASHALGQPVFFYSHYTLSLALFIFSGSIVWAILVWYPIVTFGGNLVISGY